MRFHRLLVGVVLPWMLLSLSFAQVRSGEDMGRSGRDRAVHTARLDRLSDCDAVMDYISAALTNILVQQRYGQRWWDFPWILGGDGDASPQEYTSTNVQEAGVDEMDIVKTNGTHIFYLNGEELLVLKSWPVGDTEIVSRTTLEGSPHGLLLYGNILVAISMDWNYQGDDSRFTSYLRLSLFDVSDPTQILLMRSIDLESWPVGARLIDSDLYLVLSGFGNVPQVVWNLVWRDDLGLPDLPWDASDEERETASEKARRILSPLVQAVVSELSPEDILPLQREKNEGMTVPERSLLLSCRDLYETAEASSVDMLSVMHLDLDRPLDEIDGNGIFASGWTVYSSSRNIYVGQSSWWWGWRNADLSSDIHVFDITGDSGNAVRYSSSGEVPGWIQSQFSFSEYDGYLRVATTMDDWVWGTQGEDDARESGSVISVLKDSGAGELGVVGQLSGIAPGEQIYASRMMGERAYLVTFEQVDPLFTIDLSDPENPTIAGQLKIPGYSAYLHPVDETHLLAVGMAGDEDGNLRGLAVNLFDVGDFSNPVLLHSFEMENETRAWSWSETFSDHHAFTFHGNILSIPAYLYSGNDFFSGLLVLRLDLENGFEDPAWIDHGEFPPGPQSWYSNFARMRRSIYIEDSLFSLSDRGVKVNELEHPEILKVSVPFFQAQPGGNSAKGVDGL